MAAATKPLVFPPFMTASSWRTVLAALLDFVIKRRSAPRMTNGETITVIMSWMPPTAGIRADVLPLWDQFAAAAYGWNPATGKLDTSAKNRDAWFPDALLVALWAQLTEMADSLDERDVSPAHSSAPARIDLDGRWDDIVFQNVVKHSVETDGSITDTQSAHVAFKIPLPACKGKDGKPTLPKCKRVMKRWPYLCEEWEKCDPILVDDPITKVGNDLKGLAGLALLVGAFWLLFGNSKPKRRRARGSR